MSELSVPLDSSVTEIVEESKPTKEYLNPYWSNKSNRHLIVTVKLSNGVERMASIQDTDGTNPDMKEILKVYTEEQIDENTRLNLEKRNANIKKTAERRESQKARAQQEALFAVKLESFEIDKVKNSKNTELKKLIRKAKSVVEVQAYTTILLMKELESAEEEQ